MLHVKVKTLCCSGECIAFHLIWFYQVWLRVLDSSSTKSTTGSLPICEFISVLSSHFLYTFTTLGTLLLTLPFLPFPHSISVSSDVPSSLTHGLSAHASSGLELSKCWEIISYAHLDWGIWSLPLKMDGALNYDCSSLGAHNRVLDPLL